MADKMVKSIPDHCTLFYRIHAEKDKIYIVVNHPEETSVQKVDVFSHKGTYLYQAVIRLPEGYSKKHDGFRLINGCIYVIAENSEENISLFKFKIINPAL